MLKEFLNVVGLFISLYCSMLDWIGLENFITVYARANGTAQPVAQPTDQSVATFPIGISALGVTPATSHAPPGPAPASQRHRSSEIGYFRETTSPPLRHPKDPSRGMPAGARGDSP